jgi:hypothetical protein
MSNREKWLNGHTRVGVGVLIDSTVHCAGCGRLIGRSKLFKHDSTLPLGPQPEWPFNKRDCPVCRPSRMEPMLPV